MARLVSRAELARVAGVSDVAVSKACKERLAAACVGKRVDLDHPAVGAYLRSKGKQADAGPTPWPNPRAVRATKPTKPPTGKRRRANKPEAPPEQAVEIQPLDQATPEDIERYAHMSLRDLTKKFGTSTAFRDWLTAHKTIEDVREKRLKNDELDGRLVPRGPVKTHVFGLIDGVFVRLLRDTPKTMARRLYAMARSDEPVERAEATVRELLGSILEPMKASAARVLREAGKSASKGDQDARDAAQQ